MKSAGRMIPLLMKMLVKKPDTVLYPKVEAKVPENFRGALEFEKDKCIGCKICERVCPTRAIEIEKTEDETGKKFTAYVLMDHCIFCGQCTDSCPKKALHNTENFELARLSTDEMRVKI